MTIIHETPMQRQERKINELSERIKRIEAACDELQEAMSVRNDLIAVQATKIKRLESEIEAGNRLYNQMNALCDMAKNETKALQARVKELEAEKGTILENSINLVMSQSCDRHNTEIRKMSFGEFVDFSKFCPYCARERIAALESAQAWHTASEPPESRHDQ